MGGNSRQKRSSSSSSFSIFNLFKSKRSTTRRSGDHDIDYCTMQDEAASARSKVWPSDEDRGRWVADPAINRKAEDFIANFHRNIATDSEPKTFTIASKSCTTTAAKA